MVLHCAFKIVQVSIDTHSHYMKSHSRSTMEQSPESPYSVRPVQLSPMMICIVLTGN